MAFVVIIGAGISGIAAARVIAASGNDCLLLDKSRGVGGRMASRRTDNARFDHGAPYFSAQSPNFKKLVHEALETGILSQLEDRPNSAELFFGKNGMTALPKSISERLEVWKGYRVLTIRASSQGYWEIGSESANSVRGDVVISTVPLPQFLDIVEQSDLEPELDDRFLEKARSVEYHKCISALVTLSETSGLEPLWFIKNPSSPFRFIGDNQLKGISTTDGTLTVQLDTEHSEQMFSASSQEIESFITQKLKDQQNWNCKDISLHKWRFSEPKAYLQEKYSETEFPAPLLLCGDAFGIGGVEGAYLSGVSAGGRVLEFLSGV